MKKTIPIIAVALFGAIGCTSTVTLGPKANETSILGASAGEKGAKLTVPFASAEVGPSETSKKTETKKK